METQQDEKPATAQAPLSTEQAHELLRAIEQMRQVVRNQRFSLHGWTLEFVLRRTDPTRGDMCAIPPGGHKIFSIVGVRRWLGLEATRPEDRAEGDAARPPRRAVEEPPPIIPEGQRRASSTRAHLAWRAPPPPDPAEARRAKAEAKLAQQKAEKAEKAMRRRSNRVQPKSHTSVQVLRKLRDKYSVDQLEWCRQRFPEALQQQGWLVLPEDATGHNFSSYGEAHYMCAVCSE